MTNLPLHGVRVVDLSRLVPGPLASRILSDLGAEVIRVESPDGSDYSRYLTPLSPDGTGVLFQTLNHGKKSITLDLKSPAGHDHFLKLLKSADILLESFRPGVMKKLNLSPSQLQDQFPRLIICSMSGFGQTGSSSKKAGHDLNFMAKSGILGSMHPPAMLPVTFADIAGGSWPAVMQILAALYARERTQKGCTIDVSMTAWTSSLLFFNMVQMSKQADQDSPMDLLAGDYPCYSIYQTQNGYLTVAALESAFWEIIVETLGLPHLKSKAFAQKEEAANIKAELQNAFIQKTNEAWKTIFEPLDVCVETVISMEEAAQSSPKLSLQINGQEFLVPKFPISDALTAPSLKPAPVLGENNGEFKI